MSVTLNDNSQAAAFPDRPASDGRGLLVSCDTGTSGQEQSIDLLVEQTNLHARCLLGLGNASGGGCAVMRGTDDAGDEAWRVMFDFNAGSVEAVFTGGHTLSHTVVPGPAWHCLEVGIDHDAGGLSLRVDGQLVDSVSASVGTIVTRKVWNGASHKDDLLAGDFYIDELRVDTQGAIGPVLVVPPTTSLSEPSRWLVVFNTAIADTGEWAEDYRQTRGVPFANLLGLSLPTTEGISVAEYDAMRASVEDYLAQTGLADQVAGILMGMGTPLRVTLSGGDELAVASLMHGDGSAPGLVFSPWIELDASEAMQPSQLNGYRLAAQLDGQDLDACLALNANAAAISSGQRIGDGGDSTLFLDPHPPTGLLHEAFRDELLAWSDSIDRMQTRVAMRRTEPLPGGGDARFDSLSADGFFWGWDGGSVPSGWFAEPAGSRAFFYQANPDTATGVSLRSVGSANWVASALQAGYAAAAGTVDVMSEGQIAEAPRFFGALRRGACLAEAWALARPTLRDALYPAGDPLMTVPLPRAGWELVGPAPDPTGFDASQPSHVVPDAERSLALVGALAPTEGAGWYTLRHTDAAGVTEQRWPRLLVIDDSGTATTPPWQAAYPNSDDWSPGGWGDALELVWVAGSAGTPRAVAALELERDADGTITMERRFTRPFSEAYSQTLDRPAAASRYRWVLVDGQGVRRPGPWSVLVQPAGASPSAPPKAWVLS